MATNLALDEGLIEQAQRLGKHPTKRAAVNEALAEYVLRLRQRNALDLLSRLEWDPSYDYKAARRKR
ncbi:hypothetical protein BH09MYX1_BH09MYX1_03700 [soil metagenome]